jgi:hypothetical protein
MTRTYHINPKTGNVGPCQASRPSNCPFGSTSEGLATHYASKQEAADNAEKMMSRKFGTEKREAKPVTPEAIKNVIASFETKSAYSSSMSRTYNGGIHDFVLKISKYHNGGVHGVSGYRPVPTPVGNILFRKNSDAKIEFEIDGKPYAIDKRKTSTGWIAYSDPYRSS